MTKQTIAAFDFDKTLTRCDTLLPFLLFYAGCWRGCWMLFCELPILAAFLCGFAERQQAKERVLTRFFKGRPMKELEKKGEAFASGELDRYVKAEALEKVCWHREQGHKTVLISASLDLYLIPWARAHGFDEVISSRLMSKEGLATGKLEGANCWGSEKVRRLIERIGPLDGYQLHAYGDSRGDKELLESADYPNYRTF